MIKPNKRINDLIKFLRATNNYNQFINNMNMQRTYRSVYDIPGTTVEELIKEAFNWNFSYEGYAFWEKISTACKRTINPAVYCV